MLRLTKVALHQKGIMGSFHHRILPNHKHQQMNDIFQCFWSKRSEWVSGMSISAVQLNQHKAIAKMRGQYVRGFDFTHFIRSTKTSVTWIWLSSQCSAIFSAEEGPLPATSRWSASLQHPANWLVWARCRRGLGKLLFRHLNLAWAIGWPDEETEDTWEIASPANKNQNQRLAVSGRTKPAPRDPRRAFAA